MTDIKGWVVSAIMALGQIFWLFGAAPAKQRFNAGDKLRQAEEDLSLDSFVELTEEGVCVRVAPTFVNHLYATPEGPAKVIVAFDTRKGSITVSRESDAVKLNARVLVQQLWGDEAGGHDGIAGSPRSRRMTLQDMEGCVNRVKIWLRSAT